MTNRTVDLDIAGQRIRVQSSASAEQLQLYCQEIDGRLRATMKSGRASTAQSMALVALTLASELDELRKKSQAEVLELKMAMKALQLDSLHRISQLVERIDRALDHVDENDSPLPPLVKPC